MRYLDLQKKIKQNIFTLLDVEKLFPAENTQTIKIQLSRFAGRGLVKQIKRGLYCFELEKIDEFFLANTLYKPSYISLESALNYYRVIPDVAQAVTSVALTTSKDIKNDCGRFYYSKISRSMFFGYNKVPLITESAHFKIAKKEKALLDFFYIRKIKHTRDLRLSLQEFDLGKYKKYAENFPRWVQKIKLKS